LTTPYFPPLAINGVPIDLSHLEPFSLEIESRLANKKLKVHVTFSTHCFSKGYEAALHPAGEPIIEARKPNPRTFCPIRYRLSHALPEAIQRLANPKAKVAQTAARRNWAYSMTIEDPRGPYHVFFEIRRSSSNLQDLNLVVESAYHQTQGPPSLLGTMGFLVLCSKVYMRQPTTTQR
jgi:hypothetical protein